MTDFPVSRLNAALVAKGFVRVDTHHSMYWLVGGGKRKSIHTWISHSQRKVDDWLLRQVSRQLRLTKRELLQLILCEISGEQYVTMMVERGYVRG